MATITYDAEAPGKGAVRPALFNSPRVFKFVTGSVAFSSSYLTGGETIADIFDQFAELKGVVFDAPNVATKRVSVDYTNEKLKVFIEDGTSGIEAEAANASDQSGITGLRFLAWGAH